MGTTDNELLRFRLSNDNVSDVYVNEIVVNNIPGGNAAMLHELVEEWLD